MNEVLWPNGQYGSRPYDGQRYIDNEKTVWQWDDLLNGWVDCATGELGTFWNRPLIKEKRCTCGKEKAKDLGKHSDWCEKYVEEKEKS